MYSVCSASGYSWCYDIQHIMHFFKLEKDDLFYSTRASTDEMSKI